MTVSTRPATRDDVAAVADLEQTAFPDAWSPAYLIEVVDGLLPTLALEVAEVDGEFAGYTITSVVFEVGEIQRIATVPRLRRRGVAIQLVNAFLELALVHGVERILLEVREDNAPAVRLYRSNGFVEIDRRPGYYSDGTDAVVYRLDVVP